MSDKTNQKIIEEVYAAYGRGDLDFILSHMDPDVEWKLARPADIPWGGKRKGPEGVKQFFAIVAERLQVEDFGTKEIFADGDRVLVVGHERMRVKATGRGYAVGWVHSWTLKEGRVVAFREYTDTASIVDALHP